MVKTKIGVRNGDNQKRDDHFFTDVASMHTLLSGDRFVSREDEQECADEIVTCATKAQAERYIEERRARGMHLVARHVYWLGRLPE